MRSIIKFILLITGISFLITSCDKVDQLPNYGPGKAPVLTATPMTIAAVAADSDKVALTLNWTYPDYATDSSNIKYTIEIDTSGKRFTSALVARTPLQPPLTPNWEAGIEPPTGACVRNVVPPYPVVLKPS